jgi:hypothetical protein
MQICYCCQSFTNLQDRHAHPCSLLLLLLLFSHPSLLLLLLQDELGSSRYFCRHPSL